MRKAVTSPAYCSGCFQARPETRHVDFEACYDGPNIEAPEVGHGIRIPIDDLILCEKCIAAAAELLGYVNKAEIKQENIELGEAVEDLSSQLSDAIEQVDSLRASNDRLMDNKFSRPSENGISIQRKKQPA